MSDQELDMVPFHFTCTVGDGDDYRTEYHSMVPAVTAGFYHAVGSAKGITGIVELSKLLTDLIPDSMNSLQIQGLRAQGEAINK